MSVRLERISLREIHLPLVEPFRTANGAVTSRRVVLAESTDAEGRSAWSECVAESAPTYSAETVDGCWLALTDWVIPAVLGRTFHGPVALHTALAQGVRGNAMARATVEMGAWALDALRLDVSLATLLARTLGCAPRSSVDTGIALGLLDSPPLLADRVALAVGDGYRRIKVKVQPGHDTEWIRAARASIGTSSTGSTSGTAVQLSVDANCSYTLDDASHVAALETMDTMNLVMIEQPLAHDDLVRHAELQRRLRTPLCLDESIGSASAAESMIALGSARIVNLKPGRVGGLREALVIHELCASAGIPLWCGGMLETGIGRAYNVALASLPGFSLPGDLSPSARYWDRDVVTPAWTMDGQGAVRVPIERSGLGVDVDVGRIDDLTVRAVSLTAQ